MDLFVAMINQYYVHIHFQITNKSNVQKYVQYIKTKRKNAEAVKVMARYKTAFGKADVKISSPVY